MGYLFVLPDTCIWDIESLAISQSFYLDPRKCNKETIRHPAISHLSLGDLTVVTMALQQHDVMCKTQCHETILIFSKFYHLRGIAWPYPQEWVHYGSFPHIWLVVSPYFPTFCNISLINFPEFPILWWMNSIAFLWHPRDRFGSFGCSAATCSDVAKPAPVGNELGVKMGHACQLAITFCE